MVYGFDKDGTVVGSLNDYEANWPGFCKNPYDHKLILPVCHAVRRHGGIILSNQDGITRLKGEKFVRAQMDYLMTSCRFNACIWSVSTGDIDGDRAHVLLKKENQVTFLEFHQTVCGVNFRKPQTGLIEIAKMLGFEVTHYVGDLGGNPDWANGDDRDLQFARNAGIPYINVHDYIASTHKFER